MPSDPDANPFNTLPPAVTTLAVVIGGIELALWLGGRGILGGPGSVGWRLSAIEATAFSPALLDHMIITGDWTLHDALRFFTYPFVHFSFTHMVFAVVFLLALGKMVGEALGGWAVIAIFFSSAAVGALAYSALLADERPLVGAFPAVYGLIGGYTFLLWLRLGIAGAQQSQAFSLIGMLAGIQLFFALFFTSSNDWVADLAGFATGFAVSPLVAPGGIRRAIARLRRR